MTRAQIKTLAEGGVHHFQTGIESLSSNVLRLMRKGVRAAQNVNLLRWSAHYGLNASWNLLWGFPGETEEDYRKQAVLIPHLVHLQPPTGGGRIAVERFSPFHSEPERFGIVELEPIGSLAYIYPKSVRHTEVSYLFEHRFRDELAEAAYAGVVAAVEAWRREWRNDRSPLLIYRWTPGLLRIEDGRNPEDPKVYRFEAPLSEIYAAIVDRPLSAGAIAERLQLPVAADEIAEALDLLADKGLVMRDEELFLALALPAIPAA
jgi:hypothetical protein